MATSGEDFVRKMLGLRGERQVEALAEMYAPDALIVRHGGASDGHPEIASFLADMLTAHGKFDLASIDALTDCDDVIVFDATVETDAGFLQIAEVLVLDADGLIRRHIPSLQGYWGR